MAGSSSTSNSAAGSGSSTATASQAAFIAPLKAVKTLTSTVPANGNVNPYGIVMVPRSVGSLRRWGSAGQQLQRQVE